MDNLLKGQHPWRPTPVGRSPSRRARVLVALASYGTRNDAYLHRLLDEYCSMSLPVDVVVLSNVRKPLPPNVEIRVGMPSSDPWSLPFAHKRLFVERADRYDLFVYSEDDTLITERHLAAFLDVTQLIEPDEVAGFLRSELGPDERMYYSTVHSHFHWDVRSVCRRGDETFARFTNDHAACFMLTRRQLQHVIASGGFDVGPHSSKYDMLVTAATDPYTQCGLKKLICISRLDEFTCSHLSNRYVGSIGAERSVVDIQIAALLEMAKRSSSASSIAVETRLPGERWSKSYYERRRDDLLDLIPPDTKHVLSIGCGWGKTEQALVARNIRVSAIPLDNVIGRLSEMHGVTLVHASLDAAPRKLAEKTFDALLISNLLHLIEKPADLLRSYAPLVRPGGCMIVSCPNVAHASVTVRRLLGWAEFRGLRSYARSGVHVTSPWRVRGWLRASGFAVSKRVYVFDGRWNRWNRSTFNLAASLLATEFAFVAKRERRTVAQRALVANKVDCAASRAQGARSGEPTML